MGWAYEQMLGYLDWENLVWLKGHVGLVPTERMVCGMPPQCQTKRLCGRAAHSSALGVEVRNAGMISQLDCWEVLTGLCVDGGRRGGRLHLNNKHELNGIRSQKLGHFISLNSNHM